MNKKDTQSYIEYCASITVDELITLITGLSTNKNRRNRLRIAANVYNIRRAQK